MSVPAGKSEEDGERPTSRGAERGASWEEEEGKISSSEGLRSLLDVFEQRSPGVHHGFEGVFAAGSHALVGVEQHGQLPVGFVHLVPKRQNNSEGYKATDSPEQPCFGWKSTVGDTSEAFPTRQGEGTARPRSPSSQGLGTRGHLVREGSLPGLLSSPRGCKRAGKRFWLSPCLSER